MTPIPIRAFVCLRCGQTFEDHDTGGETAWCPFCDRPVFVTLAGPPSSSDDE